MVRIGNFLFRYRNALFPVFCLPLFFPSDRVFSGLATPISLGLLVSVSGQAIRALTIGLVYIIRGGRNRRVYADTLVTDGIFSHCRNPLYLGNIMVFTGLGIISNTVYGVFVIGPLFIFVYQAIVRAEEDFLRRKFGAAFDGYAGRVNRWLPDLRGLTGTVSGMVFNWRRVLVKEYNSTYIWTTVAVVLVMKNLYEFKGGPALASALPYMTAVLIFLLAGYIAVRFLKKTGRIRG